MQVRRAAFAGFSEAHALPGGDVEVSVAGGALHGEILRSLCGSVNAPGSAQRAPGRSGRTWSEGSAHGSLVDMLCRSLRALLTAAPLPSTRSLCLLLLLGVASGLPQEGSAQAGPDLNRLALDWSRGRYLSPVICQTGEEVTRGGRRLMIAPGPRHTRPPVNRILFADLDTPTADRCFNELGDEELNVVGSVQFRLRSRSRPDTATHDFKAEMRRNKGFEFHITAGQLRISPPGASKEAAPEPVDFRGGSAKLVEIARGSDTARLLGDLRGLRKLMLELKAPSGETLRMPLVMTEAR